jgi:hypothetical protein
MINNVDKVGLNLLRTYFSSVITRTFSYIFFTSSRAITPDEKNMVFEFD